MILNRKQNEKMLQKLERCTDVFADYVFTPLAELEYSIYETDETLFTPPDAASFKEKGERWGGEGRSAWFKARYTVTEETEGQALYLIPQVGGYEALLRVNGKAMGTYASKIVVTRHGNHYVRRICADCKAGDTFDIVLEFYAGHYVIGCHPFEEAEKHDFTHPCGPLLIARKEQDIADFIYDLKTCLQLLEISGRDSFLGAEILNVLTEVHRRIFYDPETTEESLFRSRLKEARGIMRQILELKNGDFAPEAVLCGHSHMDTAWLWPVEETIRKNARTVSNQLALMDEFPEYRFIMSSACHYKMLEEHYPDIFEAMKKRVEEGRFEVNGAVWVECDCNLAGSESLVRQFLWGQRYTEEKFGRRADCFWLPDTFGYSAAVPQIMRDFGVRYFLTTKLDWNDTTNFPYETFRWQGIDGSEVLTHFFVMDLRAEPESIVRYFSGRGNRNYIRNKQVSRKRLLAFGFGDGGGGPEFESIEMARRLRDLQGCPRVSYDSVSHFMQSLEKESKDRLPLYRGELYLELHRGTLSSKQAIKRLNRQAEIALHNLELLEALQAFSEKRKASDESYRPLWETLLLNQFHDILPGTCIARAHDEAISALQQVCDKAEELSGDYLKGDAGLSVLNPLPFARKDIIYYPADKPHQAAEGFRTQFTERLDGQRYLAIAGVEQKPFSARRLPLRPALKPEKAEDSPAPAHPFIVSKDRIETPFAVIRKDEDGCFSSFIDKHNGRELCAGRPLNTFVSAEDVPAAWDNWDIDADQFMKLEKDGALLSEELISVGSAELRIRQRRRVCGNSTITQDIVFYADSPLVNFETVLDWKSPHRLLKTVFATRLRSDYSREEIQFGHIKRPTSRNTPYEQAKFEVSCHKYADISEPDYGISILNNAKYGISIDGGTMALTLAKGGMRPDPRGDAGRYAFSYAFLPHRGGFSAETVIQPAYCYNYRPLFSRSRLPEFPLFEVSAENVITEAEIGRAHV